MILSFALRHKLLNQPGWEWSKHYIEMDLELNKMVKAYHVSRESVNIKFGIEVPQSTRQAMSMDEADESDLWKKAMEAEITQLHAHDTFIVVESHEKVPPGYKMIPYH